MFADRLGIVIAGEPDPVTPALQRMQIVVVFARQPRRPAAVMETVAERDHDARRVMRDETGKARQRRRRVVRRQQLPARGKARAFLQMQIGDGEQALLGPIERAGAIGEQRHAGKDNEIAHAFRFLRRQAQCIASLINSSAASAKISSAASP